MKKYLPRDKKPTPKQFAFVIEYCRNGMDAREAYKKAFGNKNLDVCYTEGMRLLKLPWIEKEVKKHKTTLDRIAARLGMSDEKLLQQHKKLIFARKKIYDKGVEIDEIDDYGAISKGLEMIYRLLGKNAAERKQFEGPGGKSLFPESDLSKLDKDELVQKRNELLRILQGI